MDDDELDQDQIDALIANCGIPSGTQLIAVRSTPASLPTDRTEADELFERARARLIEQGYDIPTTGPFDIDNLRKKETLDTIIGAIVIEGDKKIPTDIITRETPAYQTWRAAAPADRNDLLAYALHTLPTNRRFLVVNSNGKTPTQVSGDIEGAKFDTQPLSRKGGFTLDAVAQVLQTKDKYKTLVVEPIKAEGYDALKATILRDLKPATRLDDDFRYGLRRFLTGADPTTTKIDQGSKASTPQGQQTPLYVRLEQFLKGLNLYRELQLIPADYQVPRRHKPNLELFVDGESHPLDLKVPVLVLHALLYIKTHGIHMGVSVVQMSTDNSWGLEHTTAGQLLFQDLTTLASNGILQQGIASGPAMRPNDNFKKADYAQVEVKYIP